MGNVCSCRKSPKDEELIMETDYLRTGRWEKHAHRNTTKRSSTDAEVLTASSPSVNTPAFKSPQLFRSPFVDRSTEASKPLPEFNERKSSMKQNPNSSPMTRGVSPKIDNRPRNPDGTIDHFSPIRRKSRPMEIRSPNIMEERDQEKFIRAHVSPISQKINDLNVSYEKNGNLTTDDVLEISQLLHNADEAINQVDPLNRSRTFDYSEESIFFNHADIDSEPENNNQHDPELRTRRSVF